MSIKWFVYILLSADSSLYTGISPDPQKRFEEHKAGRGGAYTRSHKPLRILYTEELPSQSAALKRDAQIKKLPRERKLQIEAPGVI